MRAVRFHCFRRIFGKTASFERSTDFRELTMRNRYTPIAAAISLALATFAGQAGAVSVNKYWACSVYYWEHDSCWSPSGPPTSDDAAWIAPVGNNDAEVKLSFYQAVADQLIIDSTTSGYHAQLKQSDYSTLGTAYEFIGNSGTGFFYQSGGTNSVSRVMILGGSTGAQGFYDLSAGTLTNSVLYLGDSGFGRFNQSGGSHVVTDLNLGLSNGSAGTYYLSSGTLNVTGAITSGSGSSILKLVGGTLTVGSGNIAVNDFAIAGNSTYTQSSGVVGVSYLALGDFGSGHYQLAGGSLTTIDLQMGMVQGGSGTFSQLAGSNTVTGNMTLAASSYSHGTYTLSGGTLNVGGAITTGVGSSTLNLDGGVLSVGSGNIAVTDLNLGSAAGSSGSYVQTKGTVAVKTANFGSGPFGGNLNLGSWADSAGVYTLSGGSLVVSGSIVGGAGVSTLNLDGGTLNVGSGNVAVTNLTLGSQPGKSFVLYIAGYLADDTITSLAATNLTIGGLGSGYVYQVGGSNSVGTLTNNGYYTFAGGSLTIASSLINNGLFELSGATLNNAGTTENNGTLSGYGRINSGGAFTNNAAVSQSGGHLTLAGAGLFTNNNNWDLQSGYQLKLEGSSFENAGVLSLNNGLVTGTGTLTNTIGGTVTGRGVIATTFANAGTLVLADGATTVTKGFVNSGVIQLGGNTALLNGGAVTNTGLIQGYGKVASAVTNTGSIQASGGTLTLTQAISNGGNLIASNASTLLFQGGLTANSGNIRINGGALDNTGYTLRNSGLIQASTGVGQIYGDLTGLAGSKLIVSGGGSLSLYNTVDIQSGAELRVSAGAIATFFGQVYQRTGSVFSGTGTKFYEAGYSPGSSPGFAVDEGNVNFGVDNLYLAEIGGTSACTADCATNEALKNSSFDKYLVAGHLGVGGTLKLASWNGFVAQAGQSFDLLDWGTVSGNFSSIDASGLLLAAGTQLDTSRLYTDGVIGVTPVPELGTWATMLAGLVCLAGLSRRTRPGRPNCREHVAVSVPTA
jgi:hypothetical protein